MLPARGREEFLKCLDGMAAAPRVVRGKRPFWWDEIRLDRFLNMFDINKNPYYSL